MVQVPNSGYQYQYNGKEWQDELGLNVYDYGNRNYDAAIGRFFNMDRFSEKYEKLSPYNYTMNNPIYFIDVKGDSLDVLNNKQSIKDIKSLVRSSNRKYINIDSNGQVTLNFSNLKNNQTEAGLLSNDEGLKLLSDIITSGNNYLYEASDVVLARNEQGNKSNFEMFRDPNGVVNASENGLDANGRLTIRPREGYDGQLVIAPKVSFYEADNQGYEVGKSRSSVIFHELVENYERTEHNVNYHGSNGNSGAHQLAINREQNYHGKSSSPGQVTRIVNPRPSESVRRTNATTMLNY